MATQGALTGTYITTGQGRGALTGTYITTQRTTRGVLTGSWIQPRAIGSFEIDAGNDQYTDPHEHISIRLNSVELPDSVVWTQTQGPSVAWVVVPGSNGSRIYFIAPGYKTYTQLAFSARAFKNGAMSNETGVSVYVRPHAQVWRPRPSGLQPLRIDRKPKKGFFSYRGSSSIEGVNSGGQDIPFYMNTLIPGTHRNYGHRGEFSGHFAARQGSVPVLLTLPNNVLPASGSVNVSAHTFGTTAGNTASVMTGTIRNVPVTLTWAANVWKVNRTTIGTAVNISPQEPFVSTEGVASRGDWQLISVPKNDWNLGTDADVAPSIERLKKMTEWINTSPTEYLILGTWLDGNMTSGAARERVLQASEQVKAYFGNRYLDIAAFLASDAAFTLAGIPRLAADDAAIAAGTLPPAWSSDPVPAYGSYPGGGIGQHLNPLGYKMCAILAARRTRDFGWKVFKNVDGTYGPYLGGGEDQNPPPPPPTPVIQMVKPLQAAAPGISAAVGYADPTGDNYICEVEVAESVKATAVNFVIGHRDFSFSATGVPVYPAALASGSKTRWVASVPWKTSKSLRDRTTSLVADYAFWVQPEVTTAAGIVKGDFNDGGAVQCYTNNFPSLHAGGLVPATDVSRNFDTGPITTAAAWLASWDNVYGDDPNPPGYAPPVQVVSTPLGNRILVTSAFGTGYHQTDQPNGVNLASNFRFQVQTPQNLTNGKAVCVGWTHQIPVAKTGTTGEVSGEATSSHIAFMQCMGTGIDPVTGQPTSFDKGLRIEFQSRTKTSTDGTSDMLLGYVHIDGSDRSVGEPALAFQIPAFRGQDVDFVFELGFSTDPRKGYLGIRYRVPGQSELQRVEFFGIAGRYYIPCALIEPGGQGQRIDLQLYRNPTKFPYVTIRWGRLRIAPTVEEVDPHTYGTAPDPPLLIETFEGGANGDTTNTTTTKATSFVPGGSNTFTFAPAESGGGALGLRVTLPVPLTAGLLEFPVSTTGITGRCVGRLKNYRFDATGTFRPIMFRNNTAPSGANAGHLAMASTRAVALVTSAGTTITSPITSLSTTILDTYGAGGVYNLEFALTPGTSTTDGILEYAIFAPGSTTPIETKLISGINAGGGLPIAKVRLGSSSVPGAANGWNADELEVRELASGWISQL